MRISVTGHSVSHPRQALLFEALSELAEVQVIGPSRWGSEKYTRKKVRNCIYECLEPLGRTITSYRLRGVEGYVREFEPSVLYIMEEPYTFYALKCTQLAEKLNVPTAVFTWENVIGRSFGEHYDEIERNVLAAANVIVAGNEGARKRLLVKGVDEGKIAICPQTGINCSIFKPMREVEKTYELAYFGRMVKEKGIETIENVVKEFRMRMLWVGGRGDMTPSYGEYIGWVDYLNLPEYYNKAKLFVHFPYAYKGYSEQFAYTLAEAMACGLPVVSSDNGSILEVYKDAPIIFAEEGNECSLRDAIEYAYENNRANRVEAGINWVRKNLSTDVIADRVMGILKNERK